MSVWRDIYICFIWSRVRFYVKFDCGMPLKVHSNTPTTIALASFLKSFFTKFHYFFKVFLFLLNFAVFSNSFFTKFRHFSDWRIPSFKGRSRQAAGGHVPGATVVRRPNPVRLVRAELRQHRGAQSGAQRLLCARLLFVVVRHPGLIHLNSA